MTLDFKISTTAAGKNASVSVRKGSARQLPLYGETTYGDLFYGANLDDAIGSPEGLSVAVTQLAATTSVASVRGR